MTDLNDARVEAAARALFHDPLASDDYTWEEMVAEDNSRAELWRDDARRVLAAADAVVTVDAREHLHAKCDCVPDLGPAHCHLCSNERGAPVPWPECSAVAPVVTVDGLQERIEDTLAYYQCRETNPKADHPSMGYHAFSEEQREFLRARKSEAAAEIVRMIIALLRGGEER